MKPADFLLRAYAAAKMAEYPFPDWAACEAACASDFGNSASANKGNNLFDLRVPAKVAAPMLTCSIGDAKKMQHRLAFKSWTECLAFRQHRIATLPMYYLARRAKTGVEYIEQIAKFNSDSELYLPRVKAIHEEHKDLWI